MTQISDTCSKCGCRKGPSSEGLCPACLLTGVLEHSESPEPLSEERPSRVPESIEQYALLGEIARGGMGVVYRAEDTTTGRTVALKMLASANFAGPDELRRFRQEAEAVARLDHPNVVSVYEVGAFEGVPFFVMKLAERGSLAQRPAPVDNREAATLLLQVARAIQFAHERGVLHRDLKPANILLDADDMPMVCDFGLARLNDAESFTLTGAGLGTPAYMAPEQAGGGSNPTTTLSDVYGLGALLYQQLTGKAPFRGRDTLDVLRQLATDDPAPPAVHNSNADPDLAAVALKALAKVPASRYRSAAAFADDLERWLRGEPTLARPAGVLMRLGKWARRRPAAAVAGALTIVGASVLAAVITQGEIAVRRERRIAVEAEASARKQERRTRESEQAMRRNLYAADMLVASRALRDGHLGVARQTLARHVPEPGAEDLRGFEWFAFDADCRGDDLRVLREHQGPVQAVAFSPDGKTLASSSRNGQLLFWNTGDGTLRSAIPKPDAPTGALEIPLFAKHTAMSPEARDMLASNPKNFDGMRMRWRPSRPGEMPSLAWSPDGRWIACGSEGAYFRVWDSETGELAWYSPVEGVSKVAFSADGAHIVAMKKKSGGASGTAYILDVNARSVVRTIESIRPCFALLGSSDEIVFVRPGVGIERQRLVSGDTVAVIKASDDISTLVGSVNSPLLAAIGQGSSSVTLWNLDERKQIHRFANPAGERFSDAAFSKDGRELALVGADHLLHVFDTETFAERARLRGHDDEILGVAISPTGGLIATAGNDRTVRLWSSLPQTAPAVSYTEPAPIAAASSTEPLILIRHNDGAIECWNAEARTAAMTPPDEGRFVAGFLSEGRGFSTVRKGADGGVLIERWTAEAKPLASPLQVSTAVLDWQAAAFSSRAGLIVVSDKKKALEFIPIGDTTGSRHLDTMRRTMDRFVFSPDGKYLCGYTWPNRVNVWNAQSAEFLGRRAIAPGGTTANAFSSDSLMLATAGEDNIITVQDLASGTTVAMLRGHKAHIRALAFSPDGRTLASSSSDQTLRLWHVATWREMGTLHRGTEFTSLAFAGNPAQLVAVSGEGRMVFKGADSQPK